MSSFIVNKVTKVLGVDQDQDDDDVNTPLKRGKVRVDYSVHDGILNRSKSMVHGRMFTLCMLSFAVLCLCVLVSLSTLGLAETADIADGKGGFTVLHNIHKQKADWGKTQAASKGTAEEDAKVERLRVKVEDLEKELQGVKATKIRPPSARSHRGDAGAGKGKERDYADSVRRKEATEEANIESKVAAMDRDARSVDMAGLDAKHRHILDQMKREISEKNKLASREANKDIKRREKEIDELLPSDTNCPGPKCLISSHPHAPSRAMGEGKHDGPKLVLVHRHKPWQSDYPTEMDNIYNSKDMPWLSDVKEVHKGRGSHAHAGKHHT